MHQMYAHIMSLFPGAAAALEPVLISPEPAAAPLRLGVQQCRVTGRCSALPLLLWGAEGGVLASRPGDPRGSAGAG